MCDFVNTANNVINQGQDCASDIFQLLQVLHGYEAALFCCILWSIWKQQNNKVWNDVIEAHVAVLDRAKVLLQDWRAAKFYQQQPSRIQNNADTSKWKKPAVGRYKCNIDASFSKHLNKVGIRMCIRDNTCTFVLAKTEWFSPICEVHIRKALGLLSALEWVHELNLGPMNFEMDSEKVVDNFLSTDHDAIEFKNIIQNCQSLFRNYYENSKVEFVRRQANEAAHILVKAATLSTSFQILYVIPDCIEHIQK
ncbi:uncharacterized protein [Medicago truncatula]|uniref:uncharacterized protein n=1 Tax=Medicago truncatula TaxID=3880 RepID=UPI000D2F3B66|nr:uncharacterized protein LOC112416650 [Medicago truncatula]